MKYQKRKYWPSAAGLILNGKLGVLELEDLNRACRLVRKFSFFNPRQHYKYTNLKAARRAVLVHFYRIELKVPAGAEFEK